MDNAWTQLRVPIRAWHDPLIEIGGSGKPVNDALRNNHPASQQMRGISFGRLLVFPLTEREEWLHDYLL